MASRPWYRCHHRPGLEAGGHRGHFLSEDLVCSRAPCPAAPDGVAAVDLPSSRRGQSTARIRTALALGASAVQMGTAFLCCHEATTSALHRSAIRNEGLPSYRLTNLFSGRPARYRQSPDAGAGAVFDPGSGVSPYQRCAGPAASRSRKAGDSGFSPLWAGQNVSGCRSLAAAELIAAWVADAGLV